MRIGEAMKTTSRPERFEIGIVFIGILLAMFVVAILLMAAIQPASIVAKREREKELVFRGEAYTEAIRTYRRENHGAFPTHLKDLLKLGGPKKIRSIRQLYPNPMNPEGKWSLLGPGSTIIKIGKNGKKTYVPVGAPGSRGSVPMRPPARSAGGNGRRIRMQILPFRLDGKEGQPILGVYAKKDAKAFRQYRGKDYYNEWYFSPLVIPAPIGPMRPGIPIKGGPRPPGPGGGKPPLPPKGG